MKPQTKEEMIKQMRFAIDTQMRYKLYNDTVFPFMQSMGMKDIWQGFKDEQNEIFIGVYHLYWTPEDSGIKVLNPTKPVPKGTWKHEWLTQEEADHKKLVQQASSIIDEEKMTKAISTEMLAIHKKIKEISFLEFYVFRIDDYFTNING